MNTSEAIKETLNVLPNSIKLASGAYFDIANPTPDQVDLPSIAAALSKLCRFGGHTPHFYSVAEHCYFATWLAMKSGEFVETQRAILMHDASEAFIGDMVKPLKVMMPKYIEVEEAVERAVGQRFGLDLINKVDKDRIKQYDLMMFKAEKSIMWPQSNWRSMETIPSRYVPFKFWTPEQAERRFLGMATHLGIE